MVLLVADVIVVLNARNVLSSRTRFMIETLSNLKNNRVKKVAAGQHAGGDAVERMKKFLSGLAKKRQGMTYVLLSCYFVLTFMQQSEHTSLYASP